MKDLVGQGKPLYSSLDRAAGLLKRRVGTGAEFLKELMAIPGVKQTEVNERGLGELLNAPKMTHEQFLKALQDKPAPAIKEKLLGDVDPELDPRKNSRLYNETFDLYYRAALREAIADGLSNSEAREVAESEAYEKINRKESPVWHKEYTVPGGKNYREMLIKAPSDENVFPGIRQHFGYEPGILASMRLKDRTGPNGEKLLHLEELQSDWHQQGRQHGYMTPDFPEKRDESLKNVRAAYFKHKQLKDDFDKSVEWSKTLEDRLKGNHPDFVVGGYRRGETEEQKAYHDKRIGDLFPQVAQADEEHRQLKAEHDKMYGSDNKRVPDAPFKGNWEEMALKRLIHHAAENGYQGIVVTPGNEQADRYDLSQHVDNVSYFPDTKTMVAYKDNKPTVEKRIENENELEGLVGKDIAQKILSQPTKNVVNARGDRVQTLSGLDLKVGGEGMKGFYDKKVPNILNNIGKKYGAKTSLYSHELQGRGKERTEDEFRRAVENAGFTMGNLPMERAAEFDYEPKKIPAHYFPITDQMRQDVLKNGLPLYKEGGNVHVDARKATMDKMKYELTNRKG